MADATLPPPPPPKRRAQILLYGDSITQQSTSAALCGWGAAIADRYQRRADVLNRGFGGYNTSWFLRHASTVEGKSDLFDHENVRLVIVFFGANDASDPELNLRHHVPLDAYKDNLKEIVKLARHHFGEGGAKVVVLSPPPVCHDGRLRYQKERYGAKATGRLERTLERSGRYAAAAKEAAEEMDVPFLDLWTSMQFTPEGDARWCWRDFLSDGLHLSADGNHFVAEALLGLIDGMMPDLAVRACPETGVINSSSECDGIGRIGPWHDEIDHKDPGKAFG